MSDKMLKVKVTEKEIKKGFPGMTDTCPIALGIKKTLGKKVGLVYVGFDTIQVDDNFYKVTKKAEKFIDNFDNGKKVRPTNFTFLKD